jgi:hypothetical protein
MYSSRCIVVTYWRNSHQAEAAVTVAPPDDEYRGIWHNFFMSDTIVIGQTGI